MRDKRSNHFEDDTAMCLWMGLVNLLWVMGTVWAIFGLFPALLLALALNQAITQLEQKLNLSRQRFAPKPNPHHWPRP